MLLAIGTMLAVASLLRSLAVLAAADPGHRLAWLSVLVGRRRPAEGPPRPRSP